MTRRGRVGFLVYVVLLHAGIVVLGLALVRSEGRRKSVGFVTKVEQAQFRGAGWKQIAGEAGAMDALTRVHTKDSLYVVTLGERAGEISEMRVLPPGQKFEWTFRRTEAGGWKVVVTEYAAAGQDVTSGSAVALTFDADADGVPETRTTGLRSPARAFFRVADPLWVPRESEKADGPEPAPSK